MSTLVLRLAGPMQSWGTRSRFRQRDTEREPTKSGLLGLFSAALGRDRSEPIADLQQLTIGVRVNHEGTVKREFQTAMGVAQADGGVSNQPQLVTRYFLEDADFSVAVHGDTGTLSAVYHALYSPVWPLFLGRKSYVPSEPLVDSSSMWDTDDIEDVLRQVPLPVRRSRQVGAGQRMRQMVRLVLPDDGSSGEVRQDEPRSFVLGAREYGVRFVRTIFEPLESFPKEEVDVSQ